MARKGFTFRDNSANVIRAIEREVKNALKDVGAFVEGEAKLRSPVDTGKLRDSIDHRTVGNNRVDIGTDVEYAIYVEKGTSRQKAQPYLTPAVEQNIKEIQKLLQRRLGNLR